ncbi:MAG TPA: M23 family metallopeptidase [Candidatus Dormibacteraeota bacterium]|jgi:murein DD-endopeptidase MepM/ murein hydrolase activator NlpD|nr:M23 family metallopeptidase [Candidatus Dormibacteraeota bacterium]
MGFVRGVAVGLMALLVWTVAASRVPSHERLSLAAIVPRAVETLPFGCTSLALEPFDPFCPGLHIHTGVDLAAPAGTPVHAAASGIAHAGYDPSGPGVYVVVTLDQHVRLLYCHLSRVGVTPGQSVMPGDVIGEVGATGLATGAHLHFEVQVDGRAVDPVRWLAS